MYLIVNEKNQQQQCAVLIMYMQVSEVKRNLQPTISRSNCNRKRALQNVLAYPLVRFHFPLNGTGIMWKFLQIAESKTTCLGDFHVWTFQFFDIFIAGDFRGHFYSKEGKINKSTAGGKIIDFCLLNNFIITSTSYQRRDKDKYTWLRN